MLEQGCQLPLTSSAAASVICESNSFKGFLMSDTRTAPTLRALGNRHLSCSASHVAFWYREEGPCWSVCCKRIDSWCMLRPSGSFLLTPRPQCKFPRRRYISVGNKRPGHCGPQILYGPFLAVSTQNFIIAAVFLSARRDLRGAKSTEDPRSRT